MPDDLELFVRTFRDRIAASLQGSGDFTRTDVIHALDVAWDAVELDRKKRSDDWLREQLGDYVIDRLLSPEDRAEHARRVTEVLGPRPTQPGRGGRRP